MEFLWIVLIKFPLMTMFYRIFEKKKIVIDILIANNLVTTKMKNMILLTKRNTRKNTIVPISISE